MESETIDDTIQTIPLALMTKETTGHRANENIGLQELHDNIYYLIWESRQEP